MAITPGTRLGHYEISTLLGKGGMGEVWCARDTKLGREVAIKTLPEEFAQDADRVARFRREAQLLASLNHPNIAAIHGFEEDKGTHFLVLELVEGDTLADRLKRGAIPVEESLKLALQIAEALEAAHEKGVIHRDLKPANVKVTPEGKVKVLDFGLAKAFSGEETEANLANSPTLSMQATQQGIILGTAAYMSPEQARGNAADLRSDIWAFGCVLFEMLTGRQTFEGGTVSDVMAGVLAKEPKWNSLPANLHPRIRFLLERCLEKEAKDRCQGVAEARTYIQKAVTEPGVVLKPPVAEAAPLTPQSKLPWVAAFALGMAIAGLAVWNLRPLPAARVSQFEIIPPAAAPLFTAANQPDLAISPDGTRIVYVATESRNLHVRTLDQIEPIELTNNLGTTSGPFFSPDGTEVAFNITGEGSLRRVSVQGGPPQTIVADIGSNLRGASWGPDNTIVFGTNSGEGLMRVAAVGGEPAALTTVDQSDGPTGHWWPAVLPDGRAVLFTDWRGSVETSQIVVLNLETGEQEILIFGGTSPRYVPTGHILYATAGSLWTVPFDLDGLEVRGDSVPVLEQVEIKGSGAANFGVSDEGSLVYVPGTGAVDQLEARTLALVNRNGVVEPLNVPQKEYLTPRLSPNGQTLAVESVEDDSSVVWVYDLSGNTAIQQLTFEGDNQRPIWTPDGRQITFSSDRDGTTSLYTMSADGSGVAERLTTAEAGTVHWPGSWSPDGETLVFSVVSENLTDQDIWTLSRDSGETQSLYDVSRTIYLAPEFSPDGRWLTYSSGPPGTPDIYVEPFPPTGSRRRISQVGGAWSLWSPEGSELIYRPLTGNTGPATTLKAVDIVTEPDFGFSNEQTLPVERFVTVTLHRDYDITPDGEQFLVVFRADQTEVSETTRPQINVVLNWFEELKERVPVP